MRARLVLTFLASAPFGSVSQLQLASACQEAPPRVASSVSIDVSMEEFANLLIAALAEDHGQEGYEYVAGTQSLIRKSTGVEVSLVNIHGTYRTLSAEERRAFLLLVAAGTARMRSAYPDLEDVRELLLPNVWTHGSLGLVAVQSQGFGATSTDVAVTVPRWSLGEHMAAFLAIHYPESVQAVTPELLQRWGVPKDVLCREAEERLAQIKMSWQVMGDEDVGSPEILWPNPTEGGVHFASQILLVAADDRLKVEDGARAVLPSKDTLLVYSGESTEFDQVFLGEIERASDGAYPLSPTPLVLEDGDWKDWVAPDEDPQGYRYRNAFRRFQSSLYAEQTAVLLALQDSLIERANNDGAGSPTIPESRIPAERIAGYHLSQGEGEAELFSQTTWMENVDSLLPRVDVVALVPEGGGRENVVQVEWRRVETLAKELLIPVPNAVPPRFRTRGFPSDDMLRKLESTK